MSRPRSLLTISFLACFIGILFLLTRKSTQVALPPPISHHHPSSSSSSSSNETTHGDNSDGEPNNQHQVVPFFSLASFYTLVPYTSSWVSWWGTSENKRKHKKDKSIIDKDWNLLYHLGGNGPWIEKVDGVVAGGVAPPEGCAVEQVHMMSRHAERYPTANAGGRMLELVKRMRESGIEFKGDLEFVNDWEYFSDAPEKHHEQLTTTGPYAGVLEAFTTGVKLRTRYEHLIVTSMTTGGSRNTTHLWASHSSRVIATARYFSAGFFGLDWNQQSQTAAAAELHVIPETDDLGADTLTPGDTCLRYRDDLEYGHDYGAAMLVKFRATYLGGIADRLQKQNPHVRFTHQEIYSMQEMCGFETLVRGKSQWCHVFTRLDWMNFEYARDVIHLYRAGPGNRYGPAMGWLWLNATANLLATGPSAGPLFFSFVHDGDIIPMIAALQLFPSSHDLPVTHVDRNRTWRTSQLTPMGGRVIFERLSCRSTSTSHRHQDKQDNNIYVRINVNDGIVALPGCDGGPGKSCPLGDFANLVRKRGEEVGDFRQVCGLGPDAADRITFLHQ